MDSIVQDFVFGRKGRSKATVGPGTGDMAGTWSKDKTAMPGFLNGEGGGRGGGGSWSSTPTTRYDSNSSTHTIGRLRRVGVKSGQYVCVYICVYVCVRCRAFLCLWRREGIVCASCFSFCCLLYGFKCMFIFFSTFCRVILFYEVLFPPHAHRRDLSPLYGILYV